MVKSNELRYKRSNGQPLIKICGIKTKEEIQLLNQYPVTYIGFIFAKSKRQLTIDKAKVLRPLVRDDIRVIGVFMDQDIAVIKEAMVECQLSGVQLHGAEDDHMIQELKTYAAELGYDFTVWKTIPVKDSESIDAINAYPSGDGVLLDTYHKGATGGTGHVFNWDLVMDSDISGQLILAGGLTPENAVEAYERVTPDVMDFNSGLEVELIKNEAKVERLFRNLEEIKNG